MIDPAISFYYCTMHYRRVIGRKVLLQTCQLKCDDHEYIHSSQLGVAFKQQNNFVSVRCNERNFFSFMFELEMSSHLRTAAAQLTSLEMLARVPFGLWSQHTH